MRSLRIYPIFFLVLVPLLNFGADDTAESRICLTLVRNITREMRALRDWAVPKILRDEAQIEVALLRELSG